MNTPSRFLAVALTLLAGVASVFAAPRPPLIVPLWPEGTLPDKGPELVQERSKDPALHNRILWNISQPTLTITWPDNATGPVPCVILCPGGGYRRVVIDQEGYTLATWFNQQGLISAVLKYRLPDGVASDTQIPMPILDAQRAIRLIRAHAAEWGIQPDRILILGGSAGGHLAASVSTRFDAGNPKASDPVERQSSRPDFQVLRYPVIALADDKVTHLNTRENLIGKTPTDELKRLYTPYLHVTAQDPPAFIAHAKDDTTAPCQNSILYADALKAHGVPCELCLFETGMHGFKRPAAAQAWYDKCAIWLKANNLSNPVPTPAPTPVPAQSAAPQVSASPAR